MKEEAEVYASHSSIFSSTSQDAFDQKQADNQSQEYPRPSTQPNVTDNGMLNVENKSGAPVDLSLEDEFLQMMSNKTKLVYDQMKEYCEVIEDDIDVI